MQFVDAAAGTPRDFESLRRLCTDSTACTPCPLNLRRSLPARDGAWRDAVSKRPRQCTSSEEAARLLSAWPQWRSEELRYSLREPSLGQFQHELHALLGGLAKVDERTLRLRMQTGSMYCRSRRRWSLSRHEPRARSSISSPMMPSYAAWHIWPSSCWPWCRCRARCGTRPNLPEGGVSDISNRGPLDRLLISELAHDETTLAMRVALNEALYYRRETPPSPPPRTRKLLLDAGVRMWGVPRVFATAVGLALAASSEEALHTAAFRASDRFLDDVDFTTREGLIVHLAVLETAAHPGEALAEFQDVLHDETNAAEGVLITSDDVLGDFEFQRQLASCEFEQLYIATVSRSGRYRLVVRSRRGEKVLREATFEIDKLLATPPRRPKLIDPAATVEPAILSREPFPLLLSVPLEVERSWHVEGVGVFTYTRDGRLLHWSHPARGGTQLAAGLPAGRLLACQPTATDGKTLAVIGKLSPNGLYALQIDFRQPRVTWTRLNFPDTPTLPVAIHADKVLLRHGGNVTALDFNTGEIDATCTLKSIHNVIGRVIELRSGGFGCVATAIAFDGSQTISTPPVAVLARADSPPPLAVFESRGTDGVVCVTSQGQLEIHGSTDLKDGSNGLKQIEVKHGLHAPLVVTNISRDGQRFLLAGRSSSEPNSLFRSVLVNVSDEGTPAGSAERFTVTCHSCLSHFWRSTLRPACYAVSSWGSA